MLSAGKSTKLFQHKVALKLFANVLNNRSLPIRLVASANGGYCLLVAGRIIKTKFNYKTNIMASVYKVEIKTVSAWSNYPPAYLEKLLKDFMEKHRDKDTGLRFESTEVVVKRIA